MKRIPELDGVRGVAILAVLGAHLNLLRGGWLGVDIFFALSGFLITSILSSEFERTTSISLRHFYYRRVLRLFPALVVYVSFCGLWAALTPGLFKIPLKTALASALFYFSNWVAAFNGNPVLGPLETIWSLSIEEQFYLTWPILFLIALKWRCRRQTIAYAIILLALLSILVRFYFRYRHASISRMFEGTDVRADSLLVGCACALVRNRINIPSYLAVASCWIIAFLLFTTSVAPTYSTLATISAVSLCAGIVLLSVAQAEDSPLHPLLSGRVLIYFGQRSYSLYLWHYPLTWYLQPRLGFLPGPLTTASILALSLLTAEVSFRLVEQPFLRLKDLTAKTSSPSRPVQPLPKEQSQAL
jgi:peptidoglycan/LPS O-acetylase OafA/YrhL